jgi:hypothetical protein
MEHKCKSEDCNNPKPKRGFYCNICRNNKRRYGLTGPQRNKLLAEQKEKCKLCSCFIEFNGTANQYAACVDHCHKTGRIRGILCGNCNTWIGYLENKNIGLEFVRDYLGVDEEAF